MAKVNTKNYKSKYTINGVNVMNEPATETVSIGNAKPFRAKLCTLLRMSIELSPKNSLPLMAVPSIHLGF